MIHTLQLAETTHEFATIDARNEFIKKITSGEIDPATVEPQRAYEFVPEGKMISESDDTRILDACLRALDLATKAWGDALKRCEHLEAARFTNEKLIASGIALSDELGKTQDALIERDTNIVLMQETINELGSKISYDKSQSMALAEAYHERGVLLTETLAHLCDYARLLHNKGGLIDKECDRVHELALKIQAALCDEVPDEN